MGKIFSVQVAAPTGAVVVGLILALFQVQGWKMPTALAVSLLVILFGLLALSIGTVCLAAIKAIKQIAEHGATSATWVSAGVPGVLDCKVDGKRALDRLLKELRRWQIDIQTLATQTQAQEHVLFQATRKDINPKALRGIVNWLGKQTNRSAIYVEKRKCLFETLTGEVVRNYEVMATTLKMTDEKDRASTENLIYGFDNLDRAGTDLINGVKSYRNGVELLEQSNLTKMIREASKRLEVSLDSMVTCFTQFQDNCHRLHTELKLKCANVDSSIPHTEDSQNGLT
ncbi:MAG: hypothetical protein HYX84_08205 [Chloroflexi bacterium]|nr:hypothetical protein [Chloroflexota bacterium]